MLGLTTRDNMNGSMSRKNYAVFHQQKITTSDGKTHTSNWSTFSKDRSPTLNRSRTPEPIINHRSSFKVKRNEKVDYQNGYSTNGPFCVQQRPWTPTKRRGPISAEFQTPGPADIALPSTFGPQQKDNTRAKSPAFTFAGKHEEKNKFLTPGPGSYEVFGVNRTGKENPSGPTISGRPKEPEPYKTPAPGDYTPEKCEKTVLNASPSYTFGSKAKDLKPDNVPAPGSYDPEKGGLGLSLLTSMPSYSFGHKHKSPKIDNIPAPGAYDSETGGIGQSVLTSAPSYSFGLKSKSPKIDQTPAPGAYDPEKSIKTVLDTRPSYTFGVKHRDPKIDDIPAPGAYSPEKSEKNVHQASPCFTFGVKHMDLKPDAIPAPGAYSPENSERALNNAPSFTFGGKYKDPKPDDVPAPGAYDSETVGIGLCVLTSMPSYSFGLKPKDPKSDKTPAPNSYNIPDMMTKDGPSYSIGGKDGNMWATNNNPGPGSYNIPGSEISKQKSPAFTIRTKTVLPGDKTQKPGPGAHSPEKVVMNHTPAFTFGIRHSPFAHGYNKDAQMKMRQIQQKTIC